MNHNDYSTLPGFDKLTSEQLMELRNRLITDPAIIAIKQDMADTAMLMTIQPVIFNDKNGDFDFNPHPIVNAHFEMLRDVERMVASNFIREMDLMRGGRLNQPSLYAQAIGRVDRSALGKSLLKAGKQMHDALDKLRRPLATYDMVGIKLDDDGNAKIHCINGHTAEAKDGSDNSQAPDKDD